MNFKLLPLEPEDIKQYKQDMQEAFQCGFEEHFGRSQSIILPEKDIDESMYCAGAVSYKAVIDGEIVGGAVVVINEETQHNHLDLLFVKNGVQSRGIGKQIWFALEKLYPATKVWESCTPYFERRNIHFYVNVCGFHITEFFNEKHPMADAPEDFIGDGNEGLFNFEKRMKFLKYNKEGEEKMTDLIEEYAQKIAKQVEYEKRIEVALSLLADGMSVEFAAKHSKLSLEEVRKLAEKRSA